MKSKRTKEPIPTSPPAVEISQSNRDLLADAYKTGLIVGWRNESERGCRLTLGDRRDEYVEVAKLAGYLESLRKRRLVTSTQ